LKAARSPSSAVGSNNRGTLEVRIGQYKSGSTTAVEIPRNNPAGRMILGFLRNVGKEVSASPMSEEALDAAGKKLHTMRVQALGAIRKRKREAAAQTQPTA
jgi:hypothetical protein